MIKFKLTRAQEKLIGRHLAAIRTAAKVGQRGVFMAQIHKDRWDDQAYVRAHFVPGLERCEPIMTAVSNARWPFCYAGVPTLSKGKKDPHSG